MIEELLKTAVPVIAIDINEVELKEIADKHPRAQYAYVVGDATDDDVMAQTNLGEARGLIALDGERRGMGSGQGGCGEGDGAL